MKIFKVSLIFSIFLAKVEPANILGVFPLPGKSHYGMFELLVKRLAEVGHNVDVLTHFPSNEHPPGYKEISLAGTLKTMTNYAPASTLASYSLYEVIEKMTGEMGVVACEVLFNTSFMQDLKRSKKGYDLVMTQHFGTDCMLGFGDLFQAPTVTITTSMALPWAGDRIDNPDNPSYIPNFFSPSASKMRFFERIQNAVSIWRSKFLFRYFHYKKSDTVNRNFFGYNSPSLEELARNTSLMFVNSHFSFLHSRPKVPNLIEVGGLHMPKPKPLSKHFENLVITDTKGIIFFTMGSIVHTETFEYDKLQGMFDAFAELPYKVLWKANKENFPKGLKIPKNIHFENWMPQIDILCHPNVKLFVTHGGLFGSQEAIYCGVPRIGIPIFIDQFNNIAAAEKLGIAVKVNFNDISKETILAAAKKILENPSYKKNCERISRQYKDRPMSPLDTAVFWVEYVIRHKGAPQLRSVGANLPLYQYYLLDGVIIVSLTASLFIFVLLKIILSLLPKKQGQKHY